MKSKRKIWGSFALVILATPFFFVRTDREFINLSPSPSGSENTISLETGHTYTQKFPATRTSVSRIGLYLRPQAHNLTGSAVALDITVNGQLRAQEKVSTSFIDAEGVSEMRLAKPLTVSRGEEIAITLRVPTELSGQIGVLTRIPDETFNNDYAHFTIDGSPQAAPLAYQVYYLYHPPLAWQVAGLLLLLAGLQLFPPESDRQKIAVVSVVLAILYTLPAVLLGGFPWILMLAIAAAFYFMSTYLAGFELSLPAIVLGAAIFAFTTWWPLHFANSWHWTTGTREQPTSLQNVFLDSNQIPSANGGHFEHSGSYSGIIALAFAIIGLATAWHRLPLWRYMLFALAFFPALVLFKVLPDSTIYLTFILAFFSAYGLKALQSFLGKDKFITGLCWIIVLIVILDLFHVAAGTLEFSLL